MSQLQVTGEAKIRDIQGPVVSNSGVITALDGDASQYVRGDGTLADFPTSTGGGSSVSYYLNSSISQGTIGGVAYRQLGKTPIIGAGTDITISANGYVASYITDANDPALLEVPAGNFNCEFYFSVNSNAHNPFVYAEVYKYDGSTFTLIGTSVGVPEYLSNGTTLSPYYFAIPVSQTVLTITDRIAIRIYVNVDGRTVTLHTENGHLCQVVTTFSKGLTSLNNLTRQVQFFGTGTSGTDFNIVSSLATHTFNIPNASAISRGFITNGVQTIAGNKTFSGQNTFEDINKYNLGILMSQSGGGSTSTGYTSFSAYGTNGVAIGTITQSNILTFNSTALRTYTFPDASGTIALTSDLSSYVPYTGATGSVNLGTNNLSGGVLTAATSLITTTTALSSYGLQINNNLSNPAFVAYLNSDNSMQLSIANASNTTIILASNNTNSYINTTGNFGLGNNNPLFKLDVTGTGRFTGILTLGSTISNGTFLYTLPSSTGTLALISNLSSYVPYTGATSSVDLGIYAMALTGLSVYKNSGKATITFPVASGGNDIGFIQHEENPVDGGIMRFSVSDNDLTNDYFVFGNTQTGTFLEKFKILATGVVTIGTWNGTAITDTYISSAATWNAKQNAITLTTTGTSGAATFVGSTLNIPNYGSALSGYLPLTGGTLSGALNGTSGSFSSTMYMGGTTGFISDATLVAQINTPASSDRYFAVNNNGSYGLILGYSTTSGRARIANISNSSMTLETNNTIALTLASNQAATFLSTVTSQANGSTFGNASASGRGITIQAGSTNGAILFKNSAGGDGTLFINGTSTTMDYNFNTYSVGNALVIKNNGNILINNGTDNGNKLQVSGTAKFTGQIQSDLNNFRSSSGTQAGNSTGDIFRFLSPTGAINNGCYSAIFYIWVSDNNTGANAYSATIAVQTTSNGQSDASFNTLVSRARGINPVVSINLVSDGGGGAAKITMTTSAIATSGVTYQCSAIGIF
jgi:hypothetical protein